MPLTDEERDGIIARYTHAVKMYADEEELEEALDVRQFELDFGDDPELRRLMREARERKIRFLKLGAERRI